jgi:hypothetical protein
MNVQGAQNLASEIQKRTQRIVYVLYQLERASVMHPDTCVMIRITYHFEIIECREPIVCRLRGESDLKLLLME